MLWIPFFPTHEFDCRRPSLANVDIYLIFGSINLLEVFFFFFFCPFPFLPFLFLWVNYVWCGVVWQ